MFEGVYSVLPTPFKNGGDVDVESLKRVVDLIAAAGVNVMDIKLVPATLDSTLDHMALFAREVMPNV